MTTARGKLTMRQRPKIARAALGRRCLILSVCFAVFVVCFGVCDSVEVGRARNPTNSNWPRFRGPGGLGVSEDTGLPLVWSATKNLVWRTKLPGPGSSSPITWGDHVYVTCYTGYGVSKESPGSKEDIELHLLCVNRSDGKILWERSVPGQFVHDYVSFLTLHGYASSTPVADESAVYVYFGTAGVVSYSHDGTKLWEKDFENRVHSFGSASSPILFEDLLIVHADIEEMAVIAMKKETGYEAWRAATGERDSWSTPLLLEADGRHELIFHHSKGDPSGKMAAVDAQNGKPLWECKVLKDYLCPSPIAHKGTIYTIAYGHGAAIRAGGRGDVTGSHVVWKNRRGSEVVTPVYHDGHLYYAHQENGIAYCVDCKTGETVYQGRLRPSPGKVYASGVLTDGRLYYVSRAQGTYVVAAKPEFEQLAHNVIDTDDSVFNGTPAISHGQFLIRSNKYLYCIGEK